MSPTSSLAQVPIFQGLPETDLKQIQQAGRTRRVDKDGFYFQQGDPATHLYVLTSGRVKLSQVTVDGQQVIMRLAGPWQMFGGVALVGEETYPVSAQAVDSSQALGWDAQTLEDLMRRYPKIMVNTLHWMADHVKETQEQLTQLATERVERRVARVLLRLVRQLGKKVEGGVLIDFPLSRQDLAEMSGTTLYTVSRTLSKWEKDGLIEAGRERVLIRRPHAVTQIAEDIQSTDYD